MKPLNITAVIVCTALIAIGAVGCANPGRYGTQKGAAIGAGLGAITGQVLGRSTEATLIGTGVGALLGTIIGNYEDQRAEVTRDTQETHYAQRLSHYREQPHISQQNDTVRYGAPEPQVLTQPPGRWVTVPGRWVGNRWVPAHQEWRPFQPQ